MVVVGQWLVLWLHSKKAVSSIPGLGPSCVEFACSPCVGGQFATLNGLRVSELVWMDGWMLFVLCYYCSSVNCEERASQLRAAPAGASVRLQFDCHALHFTIFI